MLKVHRAASNTQSGVEDDGKNLEKKSQEVRVTVVYKLFEPKGREIL